MSPTTYLVKLTPSGRFAFGDAPQGEFGNRNNYFIRSNYFPQQTGVLGFVRHQLLLMNNLLTEGEKGISAVNRKEADALIGDKGFDETQTVGYGVIQNISPLFIMNGDNFYFERCREICGGKPVQYDGHRLNNYEAKKGFDNLLVSNTGCFKQKEEEVFISQEQAGIRRENRVVTDNAYYRQLSYRFSKGFCFAFYVTLQDECNGKPVLFNNSFVYFGKQRSIFKMEVSKQPLFSGFTHEVYQSQPGSGKYLCLSDVKISNEDLKDAFVIGETEPFQYQKTTNNTASHYNYKKRSEYSMQLLKRGSVLYIKKELAEKIKADKAFYNIGYNHIVAVKQILTH
ncbi:MAG TPA: type III-B CRISPR module-associated Cmr3 family protein [Chitinophagaceae bacterium]|jgi:CRISPR-associated protein Cmr3|nr:type III-B CRISPR module-associated Cmr3 family protein [Chitinophagaceae bacterium]HMU59588.1 type III-B CRISPR module-associated Cmr3 family protein [Chitinophagaceae bacterium]